MILLADQPRTTKWGHVSHDWAMSCAFAWGKEDSFHLDATTTRPDLYRANLVHGGTPQ